MHITDFLPPLLLRPFQRKDLSGSIDFLPGLSAFLNPDAPRYGTAREYTRLAKEGFAGNP